MNLLQALITVAVLLALGGAAVAVFVLSGSDEAEQALIEMTVVIPASPRDSATEASSPVTPQDTPASESLPDRTSCDEITGTEYRSETERAFYRANCVDQATAGAEESNISPPSVTADSSAGCEASVEITVSRSDVTYEVAGTSVEEIADSLAANAPRIDGGPAYGLTEYSYGLAGSYCSAGGTCGLGEITLTAEVMVTLPNLMTFAQLDGETAQLWTDYSGKVAVHEGRHVRILEEGLDEIQRQLLLIGEEPDCATLDHEIDKVWNFGGGQIEGRQRAFHAADVQGAGGLVVQ